MDHFIIENIVQLVKEWPSLSLRTGRGSTDMERNSIGMFQTDVASGRVQGGECERRITLPKYDSRTESMLKSEKE